MLSNQLHLLVELYTLNLSTHKKSEVDLRVAQALKNNQDFIYQTNQALQNLSQSIIALSLQNEKLRSQFESDKKGKEIDYENHLKEVNNRAAMLGQRVSAFEDGIVRMLSEVQGRLDEFRTQLVHHEILDQKFKTIVQWMQSFESSHERLSGLVNSSVCLLHGKIASEIESVRKDLTPSPDARDPIKAEVEEFLKSMRVDFEGLVRELALVKKALAYDEKKFENIYTLIERLKAGAK